MSVPQSIYIYRLYYVNSTLPALLITTVYSNEINYMNIQVVYEKLTVLKEIIAPLEITLYNFIYLKNYITQMTTVFKNSHSLSFSEMFFYSAQ